MSSDILFLGEEARRDVNLYYEIAKNELGKGSYGLVQMGRLKGTKVQRAIKIIDKSKVSNVERFRLEVEIMMRLNHPSILRLFDYFEDKKHVYLVLELCSGGELFDRIIEKKFYDENEARHIFKQIIKAIHYCHLNGVCHRDLKPENFIMVSKNDPYLLKVIDFGLSRTFPNGASPDAHAEPPKEADLNKPNRGRRQTRAILKTKAGTPFYIAPEVLTGNYTEKCDVWSSGVILYILFCGYPPFYGENNKEILEAVKNGKLDFSTPEWKDKSKVAVDLVKKMIVAQDSRLFADEVIKHPYMQAKIFKVDAQKLKSIVANMTAFAKLSALQKTILYFVALNLYEEDVTFLHDYFYLFENNDTGSITEASFKTVLKDRLGMEAAAAGALFAGLDLFDNKTLNYTQLLACSLNLASLDSENKLLTVFQMADIDRDERLSLADFERFLSIQFKHRPYVTAKFRMAVVNAFAESKLNGADFATFKAQTLKD